MTSDISYSPINHTSGAGHGSPPAKDRRIVTTELQRWHW